MKILRTKDEITAQLAQWKQQGKRIGVVPTMGNLHAGHLSLLDGLTGYADKIIATIYVNPTQFAPDEDFDIYPRTQEEDLKKLQATQKCDAVFMPNSMYLDGHATTIKPVGVALGYEAEFRPHFFEGVATIVLKLLQQTKADFAIFGEKDYQQLQVIKQMVRDLDLSVTILASPTIREKNGLAISSRNGYLSPSEQQIAPSLYQMMQRTAQNISAGITVAKACQSAQTDLLKAGFSKIDYFCYCDADTLRPLEKPSQNGMLLAAAHLGTVRLIDQLRV